MIQRIQSLYLLGAFILVALCFFIPVANISMASGDLYSYNLSGFRILQGSTSLFTGKTNTLFIAGGLTCLILLITIFLFKNRTLQMRLCIYGLVFSAALTFIIFIILYQLKKDAGAIIYYHIASVLPLIGGILCFLAYKAIKKDDNLVKSYDRLR
jgi:hypothetical protein